MTSVILDQVRVELTAEQIVAAFRQLSPAEQDKIRRELTHEEWETQFRGLMNGIWARIGEQVISDQEIDEEIRIVRAARRSRQNTAESGD